MKDKYSVIEIKTNTVVFTSNNYLEAYNYCIYKDGCASVWDSRHKKHRIETNSFEGSQLGPHKIFLRNNLYEVER